MDDKVSLRFGHNSEFACYLLTLTAKAKEADNSNERVWKDANSVFQDVFTGVTVVLSQGLYQRNDNIRRMFIKSGNEKWKEKKYFIPFVSARFRLCLLHVFKLPLEKTFHLLPFWSKQGLILLHNLQKWKFDFLLSFELDYNNKLRTDWDRIT